jgi:hypothetical protein
MREKEDGLGNGTSATHAAWFDVRFRAPLRHQCMAQRMPPTDPVRTGTGLSSALYRYGAQKLFEREPHIIEKIAVKSAVLVLCQRLIEET